MKKIIKIGIRCISMFLVLNLIALNNIFAVDPKINVIALIAVFSKQGAPRVDGFEEHPSHDETRFGKVLVYKQDGGTFGDEVRTIYVWNLPGVIHSDAYAVCRLMLECADEAGRRVPIGVGAVKEGMNFAKGGVIGAVACCCSGGGQAVVDKLCRYFGTTPEGLYKKLAGFFGSCHLTNEEGAGVLVKIGGNLVPADKLVIYGGLIINVFVICIGVGKMFAGIAEINEQARNVVDARTIIESLARSIRDRRYRGANILVMAKDERPVHFYNPWQRSEPPFVAFWKHNSLVELGAPIFNYDPDNPAGMPEWAKMFVTEVHEEVLDKITEGGEVDRRLKESDKVVDDGKRAALDTVKSVVWPSSSSSNQPLPDNTNSQTNETIPELTCSSEPIVEEPKSGDGVSNK